ncbi:hypothetical protein GCM10023096_76580 [Nonomuraea ferruginea]
MREDEPGPGKVGGGGIGGALSGERRGRWVARVEGKGGRQVQMTPRIMMCSLRSGLFAEANRVHIQPTT